MPKLGPRLIVLALTSLFIGGFLTWLYLQDPTTELPKPVVDPAPPETSEQKANAPRGSFQFYDLLVETEVPVEVEPEPDRPKDPKRRVALRPRSTAGISPSSRDGVRKGRVR